MKILANDGIEAIGKQLLEQAGFEVETGKISQEELIRILPEYAAICVRSATKVRKELIDACPNLKAIARGGVGMDNIVNTPAASSRSVAELAMAHMLSLSRFLYQSNRAMPIQGADQFDLLKKAYAKGQELEGKTLGIIGFGRIGQELARMALGIGMDIMAVDPFIQMAKLSVGHPKWAMEANLQTVSMDEMLQQADYISLHTPSTGKPVLGAAEFEMMKRGVIVVNASRGGTIDENALIQALESGKVAGAGLDVFDNEPHPSAEILSHPRISLTPHIGASTEEAQNKIGIELATKLIEALK